MQGPVEAAAGLVDVATGEVEEAGRSCALSDVDQVETLGGPERVAANSVA